ncbi:hypothetical protein HYDPIDRAFT_169783 [Hydnomerulius pinastri MD-312]|uniref:Uncharacterized protein n=1 Tax=Hydnomerulius pinastri MD-312 TaxID=994086 RepID=A0A0C9VTN6_9AGAM|nr:hypothetical protein HYDPIDRAFT_169783 [Hydnomerulius pinastri MD-312]
MSCDASELTSNITPYFKRLVPYLLQWKELLGKTFALTSAAPVLHDNVLRILEAVLVHVFVDNGADDDGKEEEEEEEADLSDPVDVIPPLLLKREKNEPHAKKFQSPPLTTNSTNESQMMAWPTSLQKPSLSPSASFSIPTPSPARALKHKLSIGSNRSADASSKQPSGSGSQSSGRANKGKGGWAEQLTKIGDALATKLPHKKFRDSIEEPINPMASVNLKNPCLKKQPVKARMLITLKFSRKDINLPSFQKNIAKATRLAKQQRRMVVQLEGCFSVTPEMLHISSSSSSLTTHYSIMLPESPGQEIFQSDSQPLPAKLSSYNPDLQCEDEVEISGDKEQYNNMVDISEDKRGEYKNDGNGDGDSEDDSDGNNNDDDGGSDMVLAWTRGMRMRQRQHFPLMKETKGIILLLKPLKSPQKLWKLVLIR